MQSSIINELLKLFFTHCNNNPEIFVTYFDQSSDIIGFNFRCAENRFTHISISFKRILGYHEHNIMNNGRFMSEIVHPQDKQLIEQCLKPSDLTNGSWEWKAEQERITQVKCRVKHLQGYWKYFILYARDYWNAIEKTNDKVGMIFVEKIRFSQGRECKNNSDTNNPAYMKRYLPEKLEKNQNGSAAFVSPREKEILELISNGLITKEIAGLLHISENTVITHRKNLIAKLNVRNTAELIKKATRYMLI